MKWVAASLCLLLGLSISELPSDQVAGLVLALATVLLASRAVTVPGGGRFTTFPVPVLVAAALPEVGAVYAVPLALLGTFMAEESSSEARAATLCRVSFGVLAGVGASAALQLQFEGEAASWLPALGYLAGALVYGAMSLQGASRPPPSLSEKSGDRLLRLRTRAALRPLQAGMLLAGLFCYLFAARPGDWPFLLLFLPMLSLFEISAQNVLFRLKAEQAEQAIADIVETRASARATQKALDQSDQERQMLEGIARAMRDAGSVQQGVKGLLATLKRILPDAVVLFFPIQVEDGQMQQSQVQGDVFLSPPLLASVASLARQTLREGRPVHRSRPDEGLFAMAAPLKGFGVLCAFQRQSPYSETEVYLFEQLSRKGRELLVTAKKREQERGQQLKLLSQVELLDALSQTARRLFDAPSRDHILAEFVVGVGELVPHSVGLLRCRGWLLGWGESRRPLPVDPGSPEGRLLSSVDLPLHSDRTVRYLNEGFFREQAIDGVRSGLLVAMPFEGQAVSEYLILGSHSPLGYGSEHRDLLTTLVGQLVSALLKTERLEALQAALSELAEKQSQLIQSSKMTALGTMVAGVAHEINTPLGAIALSIESAQLQLQKRPEEAEKRLRLALQALERIQGLVDRLLVFSHRSSGAHDDPAEEAGAVQEITPLETVVWDTKALTEAELKKRGVGLECRLEPCLARGGQGELTQVLVNLVLNAAAAVSDRHPQEGARPPVRVSCGVLSGPPKGDWCYLRVEDAGIGIKQEHVERIFEPFFTTKPVGVGTGLGLSIAHQIVASFGGRIQVNSKEGRGTVFTILLPAENEESYQATLADQGARAVGGP